MEPIQRFLGLVARELGAEDARFELGGQDPEDSRHIYCTVQQGFRLVAVFRSPMEHREPLTRRLEMLASAFVGERGALELKRPQVVSPSARELGDALAALVDRTTAVRAVVIDHRSPVIWGSSNPTHARMDVDAFSRLSDAASAASSVEIDLAHVLDAGGPEETLWAEVPAELAHSLKRQIVQLLEEAPERDVVQWSREIACAHAIARVRRTEKERAQSVRQEVISNAQVHCFVRAFANIYRLILAFEGSFSQLNAEGAVIQAMPLIERLVTSLPPRDPGPKGGRMLNLRPVSD
ncbi:MAG: hypothetical protein AAF355_10580 [Myxococcota bacterium]